MNSQDNIEKYLEDSINEYLKSQQDITEFGFHYPDFTAEDEVSEPGIKKDYSIIEELLNDILYDVDRTIVYQELYKKAQKKHHQYALFDLDDFVPGFNIDNDIAQQMCFKELLLISSVDQSVTNITDGIKPTGVGGLCLKIELGEGLPMMDKPPKKETKKSLAEKISKIKQGLMPQAHEKTSEQSLESGEERLQKYESFLEEEKQTVLRKFVIHMSSQFDVDGCNAGSRLVTWVDQQLHTLEERRTEYIYDEGETPIQQVLYTALQQDKYYVRHHANIEKESETRKYYPLSKAKDYVGEGANFLLMRYLAITRYVGTFELSTIYINGSMCRNIYECKGATPGFVNNNPVDICKIYRIIYEECGLVHISVTVMTVYGMIVSQEWEGCSYIIHINPLIATVGKPVPYDQVELVKSWHTDMQLLSKYLDCKAEAELKMKTYLKDHPEINDMIGDYMQSILLLKPENIMPFTLDYFTNFQPFKIPEKQYFYGTNGDTDGNGGYW
ncbi:ciliogenesis-associated TTC17-interacting protein-like [Sitophilus oryzae]|uniref:Ciliogenesis-associated TTC17-interacting protein-like n=1 Tax=Sitophilus oryzae TaxID=7048 RepID=A0A6J2XUS5_SITOR|nr:ciliogenesis-associated TTC17-interacting protein-like [Sitophilus oryzae]